MCTVSGNEVKVYRNGIMSFVVIFCYRLHEEMEDFFNYMSPTEEEHSVRLSVVHKIKSVIHSLWPESTVEVFGSFRTGIFIVLYLFIFVIREMRLTILRTL